MGSNPKEPRSSFRLQTGAAEIQIKKTTPIEEKKLSYQKNPTKRHDTNRNTCNIASISPPAPNQHLLSKIMFFPIPIPVF